MKPKITWGERAMLDIALGIIKRDDPSLTHCKLCLCDYRSLCVNKHNCGARPCSKCLKNSGYVIECTDYKEAPV